MPKVIVKPAPGPDVAGRWALGTGPRQKFKPDGTPDRDAQGNPQYWPARSGVYLPAGQDTELTITDEELRDLQSGANASLFMVQVVDQGAQPDINEGGSSMATNPLNQPQPGQPGFTNPAPATPQPGAPGTTVPPGTNPQPTAPTAPQPDTAQPAKAPKK